MKHRYAVTVTRLTEPQIIDSGSAPITFTFESHDDLSVVLDKAGGRDLFDPETTKAFVVGLKLFGGVLLHHREHPLFAGLAPHFGEFMKRLKGG